MSRSTDPRAASPLVWVLPALVIAGTLWWLLRDTESRDRRSLADGLAAPSASAEPDAPSDWLLDVPPSGSRSPRTDLDAAGTQPLAAEPLQAPVRSADPRAAELNGEESSTRQAARELAASVAERLDLQGSDAADLAELMADAAERRKSLGRAMAEAGHDIEARMAAGAAFEAETRSQRAALAERFGDEAAQQILLALARGR